MTYGSAATAEEVPAYLRSVRRGRDADPELVAEFQRRYRLIGWSPLVRITLEQGRRCSGCSTPTTGPAATGSRSACSTPSRRSTRRWPAWPPPGPGGSSGSSSPPVVATDHGRLPAGPRRRRPAARPRRPGRPGRSRHRTPAFLDALAERVTEALDRLDPEVPVLFTAHSLPKAVVDRDPGYLDQIAETIDAVVERTGLERGRWQFAYQSAGHSPEEWLKPDLKDLLPGLRDDGHKAVLVVPVQFLADHLEILYDIDIAAREEAEEAGLAFNRIELMNTAPTFIRALADVALDQERSVLQPG